MKNRVASAAHTRQLLTSRMQEAIVTDSVRSNCKCIASLLPALARTPWMAGCRCRNGKGGWLENVVQSLTRVAQRNPVCDVDASDAHVAILSGSACRRP